MNVLSKMNVSKMNGTLAVSLAINLFLFAAIGGAVIRWAILEWLADDRSGQQQHGMRYVADALPADQRGEFRSALRVAREDSRKDVQNAREGRREVARLLAAPAFSAVDAEAAAERTRAADMAIRARVESAIISFASTLSVEQRQVLAEALIQRGPLYVPTEAPTARTAVSGGDHVRKP